MKFFGTIYESMEVRYVIVIQSRGAKEGQNDLITPYQSKVGTKSLIFNPTASLVIRSRDPQNQNSCYVPLHMVYQVSALHLNMYKTIMTSKMYNVSDGVMYLDKKAAVESAKKISLFRNYLSLVPTIITTKDNEQHKGISLMADNNIIGNLRKDELTSIVGILEHLDIATFSMMAGISDALEANNGKLDLILTKLNELTNLVVSGNNKSATNTTSSRFEWQPVEDIY